jgi:hypothetical protein
LGAGSEKYPNRLQNFFKNISEVNELFRLLEVADPNILLEIKSEGFGSAHFTELNSS